MKLLFVTPFDPTNPAAWSGTPDFMLRSLRKRCDVEILHVRAPLILKIARRLAAMLFPDGPTWDYNRSKFALRKYARQIERRLKSADFDRVFSPSSIPLSLYRGDVSAMFWTDAVYPQLVGYYEGEFKKVGPSTLSRALLQERNALQNAQPAYSSEWAADAAKRIYPGAEPMVLGFGPNLERDSILRIIEGRAGRTAKSTIRLLWIGGDWVRKGGALALEVVAALSRRGIDVILDTVGEVPAGAMPNVFHHGRLEKAKPRDLVILESVLAGADFLILPSLADCTPIVVSEAAAIGLPVIATDTGGLGETVRRFGMGIVRPRDVSFAYDVAGEIEAVVSDYGRRLELEAAAFRASDWLSYDASFERLLGML